MLGMFGMMGSLSTMFLLPLMMMWMSIPVVIYLVARSRSSAENEDTQIGMKVALHLFRVLGFQLALMGVFLVLFGVISKAPTADMMRLGFGLAIPAGAVFFVHTMLSRKTNGDTFPAVRRMFEGWNLIITAIPGFISLVAFCVVLFAKMPGAKGDMLRMVFPFLLTYGGAWGALSFMWYKKEGLLPQGPAAGAFPPQQGGYPPQQGGYPPQQQGGYPPQQQQQQQQQGGYPPQQAAPQQPAAAPQQPAAYPPQGGGYPPQGGGGYTPGQ